MIKRFEKRVLMAALTVAVMLMVPQVAAAQTPTVTAGQNVTKIGVTAATQGATEQTTEVTATNQAVGAAAGSTVRITAAKPEAGKVARLKLTRAEAAEPTVPVTKITVSAAPGAANMVNTMWKMMATVEPENATDKSVTWTIDEAGKDLATINTVTGVVMGKGSGSITVRATANDGSHKYGEMMLDVIRSGISNPPTIYISSDVGYKIKAGESLPLEAYDQNGNLLNNSEVTWSVSTNPSNAGVITNGVFTAAEEGSYTVSAAYGGNTGSREITVEGSTTGQGTNNDDPETGIVPTGEGTISKCEDSGETVILKQTIDACIGDGEDKLFLPKNIQGEITEEFNILIKYLTVKLKGSFVGSTNAIVGYTDNETFQNNQMYQVVLADPKNAAEIDWHLYEATGQTDGSFKFTMPATVARNLAGKPIIMLVYSE